METCKASLDKWDLSRMICTIRRSETDRVCLSFFPAHYFKSIPLLQGPRCVRDHSVDAARPFCVLAAPAIEVPV